MTSKSLLFIPLFLVAFAAPAFAQSTGGKTGSTASLSKSDEDFLSEMPLDDFPGADELQDLDDDGIVDSEDANIISPEQYAAQRMAEDEKAKTKYVYKGTATTTLRRSIQDDRIDDGFVQGLIKQPSVQ